MPTGCQWLGTQVGPDELPRILPGNSKIGAISASSLVQPQLADKVDAAEVGPIDGELAI
jgi:hypothetical protein